MSRRFIIGIIALLSLALLVPSAAVTLQDSGTDTIESAIDLTPSEAPNGKYALVNAETGELELHFGPSNPNLQAAGLNIDSTTPFHRVFTVTNNGSKPAEVWFTVDHDGITFYQGTDTTASLMDAESAVELEPDDTISVGVLIDATGNDVESVDQFTIHAETIGEQDQPTEGSDTESSGTGGNAATTTSSQQSVSTSSPNENRRVVIFENPRPKQRMTADFDPLVLDHQVGDLVLEDLAIVPATDEDVELHVWVVEPDTRAFEDEPGLRPLGTAEVDLRSGMINEGTLSFAVDRSYLDAMGLTRDQLMVYSTAGETRNPLALSEFEPQDRAYAFEATAAGFETVTVVARVPAFAVSDVTLGNESITVGQNVSVGANVSNVGLAPGEKTIGVSLDGQEVATETVELDVNDTMRIDVQIRPAETGEFDVVVDGIQVGTLQVSGAESPTTTIATGDGDTPSETTQSSDDEPGAVGTPSEPVEEPAGFGLRDVVGLVTLLGLILLLIALIRRKSGE